MEKAILVGLQLPKTKKSEAEDSLAELSRLAETAGARPEFIILQHRQKADPAYLIGRNKALEIAELAAGKKIGTIIFDEELRPAQERNLAELINAKIVDRSRLILDIFALRARSKEGILQVERAQLEYFLPRITERFGRFEQQTGGIGTRGPGEKKLEVDQRRIRDRIALLDRDIENLRDHRNVLRRKRLDSGQPVIAITGYTNAGKSTLLNAVSHSRSVYADDKLFATLDPTTRQVKLPGGRMALFTDTVGFIKKLPHALVAAFRSTLEEITLSSCLLHVIDVSQKDYEQQTKTVLQVLKELEADKIPSLTVYNKTDLLTKQQRTKLSRSGGLLISAKTGAGLDELLERIEDIVVPKLRAHSLTIPYGSTRLLGPVYRLAVVKQTSYAAKAAKIQLECTDENWDKISRLAEQAKGGTK